MAEEYVDAEIWTANSLPFRLVKRLELAGIRRADRIVVLTNRLREWLIDNKRKPAEQTRDSLLVDAERFAINSFVEQSPSGRFEVIYAGSLIGLYLIEEMGRFFKALKAKRPHAFLRILSVSHAEEGANALKRAGLDEQVFEIVAVAPGDVPRYLGRTFGCFVSQGSLRTDHGGTKN